MTGWGRSGCAPRMMPVFASLPFGDGQAPCHQWHGHQPQLHRRQLRGLSDALLSTRTDMDPIDKSGHSSSKGGRYGGRCKLQLRNIFIYKQLQISSNPAAQFNHHNQRRIAHKTPVPHSFAFFLAKGWDRMTLNRPVLQERSASERNSAHRRTICRPTKAFITR